MTGRFWAAVACGLSSEEAGVAAGESRMVGVRWFREHGGMAPPSILAPVSGRYLSFAGREEIALLRACDCGVREIARQLGRSHRHQPGPADLRAGPAGRDAHCCGWHPRSGPGGTLDRTAPRRRKDRRWAASWSPQQIAGRLRIDFPEDASVRISHEAIYQALYIQGRGALRRELTACLRTGRALQAPRARARGKQFVTPQVLISQRPAEADDRAVAGHWEGDLILGLESSAIGTLVERTTRFTMLLHLPRMDGHSGPRVHNGPALAGHAPRPSATRSPPP
jgi:hypothetical protein